jgi:argininosuccinate synthase
MIAYCAKHKINVQASAKKPLFHGSQLAPHFLRGRHPRDPWLDCFRAENKDMFRLSVAPEDAPDRPEYSNSNSSAAIASPSTARS